MHDHPLGPPNVWPALRVIEAYRRREFSPVEVTSMCLEAARAHEELRAFRLIDEEAALESARRSEWRWQRGEPLGSLDGLPTAVKDSFDVRGYASREGSLTISEEPAEADGPAVGSMRRRGAVLLGRTTMPEFGWKAVCDSPLTGVTRNPHDPTKTPGGSSGGDGVALAVGASILGIGADIGGSVRIPAAFCGVVGFKPTQDRANRSPRSHAGVLSREGPITRTVSGAALLLDAIEHEGEPDPALERSPERFRNSLEGDIRDKRVAVLVEHPEVEVDERIAERVREAAVVLSDLGAIVEAIGTGRIDIAGYRTAYERLLASEVTNNVRDLERGEREKVDPGLLEMAGRIEVMSATDLMDASQRRRALLHRMTELHVDYDLLVTPTVPILPFEVGREVPEGWPHERWTSWTPFTWLCNMTGQPAMSVPCGWVDGLPVGLHIVGPRRQDGLVLRAGHAYERAAAIPSRPD